MLRVLGVSTPGNIESSSVSWTIAARGGSAPRPERSRLRVGRRPTLSDLSTGPGGLSARAVRGGRPRPGDPATALARPRSAGAAAARGALAGPRPGLGRPEGLGLGRGEPGALGSRPDRGRDLRRRRVLEGRPAAQDAHRAAVSCGLGLAGDGRSRRGPGGPPGRRRSGSGLDPLPGCWPDPGDPPRWRPALPAGPAAGSDPPARDRHRPAGESSGRGADRGTPPRRPPRRPRPLVAGRRPGARAQTRGSGPGALPAPRKPRLRHLAHDAGAGVPRARRRPREGPGSGPRRPGGARPRPVRLEPGGRARAAARFLARLRGLDVAPVPPGRLDVHPARARSTPVVEPRMAPAGGDRRWCSDRVLRRATGSHGDPLACEDLAAGGGQGRVAGGGLPAARRGARRPLAPAADLHRRDHGAGRQDRRLGQGPRRTPAQRAGQPRLPLSDHRRGPSRPRREDREARAGGGGRRRAARGGARAGHPGGRPGPQGALLGRPRPSRGALARPPPDRQSPQGGRLGRRRKAGAHRRGLRRRQAGELEGLGERLERRRAIWRRAPEVLRSGPPARAAHPHLAHLGRLAPVGGGALVHPGAPGLPLGTAQPDRLPG